MKTKITQETQYPMKHLKIFFRECFHGKSFLRTFQNIDIGANVILKGNCIDLGAKSCHSAYYRFLQKEENTTLTFSDYYSEGENIVKIDYNKPFPIEDNEYDCVLLMNVLEHVLDTHNLLSEIKRILKDGGTLYGVVPFLQKYHQDPHDYWRFTHEALEFVLNKAGFEECTIKTHGVGPFTVAAHACAPTFRFKPLIFTVWFIALGLDSILWKLGKLDQDNYLGLYFEATK